MWWTKWITTVPFELECNSRQTCFTGIIYYSRLYWKPRYIERDTSYKWYLSRWTRTKNKYVNKRRLETCSLGCLGTYNESSMKPQYCRDSRKCRASYAAQDVRNLSRLEVVKGTLMMIEYVTLDDWHSSFAVFFFLTECSRCCLFDWQALGLYSSCLCLE